LDAFDAEARSQGFATRRPAGLIQGTMTMSAAAAVDTTHADEILLAAYQKVTPALLAQIRGEFREMPGLTLTLRQASRLWNLAPLTCDVALRTLVDEQFLERTRHDRFRRLED
jgi:hypothetical protein